MMKKKKNIIASSLAVVLAVVLLIGGTIAYLTDESEEVTNTFTQNKNSVELDESTGNDYNIVPGTSQEKDPTVTATYTLDSYVFVEVTDATNGLVEWEIDSASGWKLLTTIDNGDGSTTYVYYQLLESNGGVKEVEWAEVEGVNWKIYDLGNGASYIWDLDTNKITYYASSADTGTDATDQFDLKTGNMYVSTLTTTTLQVLKDNLVSYSSTLTNDDMTADETVSLTFQAYIIQAQLGGTTGEGYADPTTAYYVVKTGSSYYDEDATYVALDADSTETLATQLTTALATATAENPVVVVLPEKASVSVTSSELSSAITGTAVVDLNDGTLSVSNSGSVTLSDGDDLTFVDGTVNSQNMGVANASFVVKSNSSLTLENTTLNSSGAAIYPSGDAAEVNVINSIVNGNGYGIATNAATVDNYNVVINVENSTVTASYCALLINVPGTLNVSDSTVTAGSQALIVRAGTATVTDTTLTSTLSSTVEGNESIWTTYTNSNWGSGNAVPFAVITIGNRNGTYAGDATVNLDGVTLKYNSSEENSKGIYLYGGVTYPTDNESPNKAILNYDSTTCSLGTIVRGETTYTEVNDTSASGQ